MVQAMPEDGFRRIGKKGDLTLYVTHVQFEGDGAEHPALYLRNEARTVEGGGCPAALVPFRDFWTFRPEDRDRGRYHAYADMTAKLAGMAIALYGFDVPEYRYRIHDAILDFAQDVQHAAPRTEPSADELAEQRLRDKLVIRANGEVLQ